VLKNNGYHLAHNFAHGNKYLARMFATTNVLALAFHTARDRLETLWQQAKPSAWTLKGFFQDFDAICSYLVIASCCLDLQEAPHQDSDQRQSSATHIEHQVSTSQVVPQLITRAVPTATHRPSPLKCWVSPRPIMAARKQQVLRLGAAHDCLAGYGLEGSRWGDGESVFRIRPPNREQSALQNCGNESYRGPLVRIQPTSPKRHRRCPNFRLDRTATSLCSPCSKRFA
jgi:hypothetical protein